MGYLSGLENKNDNVDVLFFDEFSDLRVILYNNYAGSAAKDNGCVNVWQDDDGIYRAEVQRRFITLEKTSAENLEDLKKFVNKWLKKIA